MSVRNAFYAQSGGVTAVINASACGVIETARQHPQKIGHVYAGHNGIIGALTEDMINTSAESDATIAMLKHTPGGAFGSCRYKLKSPDEHPAEYQRLIDVFKAHDIGYFFYNGGGDSQDTAHKVAQFSAAQGHDLACIGIPKTVDNDLPITDCSPGFGSVAKYVAVSTREISLDLQAMYASSTKVFVFEVMGRHAGWIAAAAALAKQYPDDPPHLILYPEIPFDEAQFLDQVQACVDRIGYCMVVASEGTCDAEGNFIADAGSKDAFGHVQLGGVAPTLVGKITANLGYKCHWAVADYLQRAARHIASATDVEQAYAVGKAAVEFALAGKNGVLPVIVRESTNPYTWSIGEANLSDVANVEKQLPRDYITADGYGLADAGREYLLPLIQGEDYPPFEDGLPVYARLKGNKVAPKLADEFII